MIVIRILAATSIAWLALIGTAAISRAAQGVSTIAGSGAAGIADGPARKATFLFPAGVAVGKDGSVYISDLAAQRIRVLTRSGIVRTIAGRGSIVAPGFTVNGGFRDGAALGAQFNGPEGLAIGPDGALYIADSYNACIRRLSHGHVTTIAGKCGDRAAGDGSRNSGRFRRPRALAFDRAGNLYIADYGAGLRKLSANGRLTTIHIKSYQGNNALGVAVVDGPDPVLLLTTADGLIVEYDPATGIEKLLRAVPASMPNQIVAIDSRQFIFTDLQSHDIRFFRIGVLPFVSQFTRVIAGHALEKGIDNAGFANGPLPEARFYDPMGIAIAGNRAIVADGGNRRIRAFVLPRLQGSEVGFDPANPSDKDHYEVALVGASWTFTESLGDDSICAQIERTLDRSGRFHKPVRCHTVAIAGAHRDQIEDYIKNVFPYERMDLIIMDAESWGIGRPDQVVEKGITFAQLFRLRMRQLLDVLKPLKTKLALVWVYEPQGTSDAEWIVDRPPYTLRRLPSDGLARHDEFGKMESVLIGMPIFRYDMYEDIVRYELSEGALPLYHATDLHLISRGNAFFGDRIAQGLLNAGLGKP